MIAVAVYRLLRLWYADARRHPRLAIAVLVLAAVYAIGSMPMSTFAPAPAPAPTVHGCLYWGTPPYHAACPPGVPDGSTIGFRQ
jgi:hypothetical protein